MTRTSVTTRTAAIALTSVIALFGLSACGSDKPGEGTYASPSPSSSQSQSENDYKGSDLNVTVESDGKVSWSIYADEGPARGTVTVSVGGWEETFDETVGEVYPKVNVGSYTGGKVTYTNLDGEVGDTEEFTYDLNKADPKITVLSQTPETATADTPIALEVEVKGNALLKGTVTATDTVSNTRLTAATVNDDGIAVLTFQPGREGGRLTVRLTYSGDNNNLEASRTQTITLY